LKWGNGDKEIGIKKIGGYAEKRVISKSKNDNEIKELNEQHNVHREKVSKTRYQTTFSFGVDSSENIYILDTLNQKVKVFKEGGDLLRTISLDDKPNKMLVGDDGDIYFSQYSKELKKFYTIRVSENNTRVQYEAKLGKYISGNTIYDWNGMPLLVMRDKKENPNNKSVRYLFKDQDVKVDNWKRKNIVIKSEKIQSADKKNNVFGDDFKIPLIEKNGLISNAEVLGIGNGGNIYIWYGFFQKHSGVKEEAIYVYSREGKKVAEITLNVNEMNPDYEEPYFVKLAKKDEIYHMWMSKNGVHIYKWFIK
jgi:hypothetical protein